MTNKLYSIPSHSITFDSEIIPEELAIQEDPIARRKRETLRSYIKRMKREKLLPKDKIAALEAELPVSETQVQKPIWDWLDSRGYFPIKFENQATFDPAGFRRNFAGGTKRKGVSDLIFFIGGKVVFCEVKVPDRLEFIIRNWEKIMTFAPKPRIKGKKKVKNDKERYKEQIGFIEEVKARGQIAFFADGLPCLAKELLKNSHLLSLSDKEIGELQSLTAN